MKMRNVLTLAACVGMALSGPALASAGAFGMNRIYSPSQALGLSGPGSKGSPGRGHGGVHSETFVVAGLGLAALIGGIFAAASNGNDSLPASAG